jgi:glycerophosphoryl diester phosphodiesterase
MVLIYAHRGASAEFPENTLAAFRRALELGVYGIELDLHLSSDGVPVVIHDETVDRTTDGSGAVGSMTLDALRELNAGHGERIPTLAEVLDLVGDQLHVDVEVKAAAAADAVLAEAAARPGLRWAMSSFNHDVLRHARTVDETIELWPLTVGASDDVIETAISLGSPQIALNDHLVNADVIALLAAHDLRAWVWTVNDPDRAVNIVEWGVAGFCSDDPAAMQDRLQPGQPR